MIKRIWGVVYGQICCVWSKTECCATEVFGKQYQPNPRIGVKASRDECGRPQRGVDVAAAIGEQQLAYQAGGEDGEVQKLASKQIFKAGE